MADLTLDLHTSLTQGSTLLRFHSRLSLSVSVFQVILGGPGPRFPSICMSQTVFIAPLDRSTCPNQGSLFSLRITSRSSISSWANSSFDLTVTVATFSGFALQICLIMALSLLRKPWRSELVKGQVWLAWSITFRSHELYTWPRVL